jgi:hypothetical protein
MKPTPKAFASRLAPLQNKFSVVATTPSTSSRCPASMLRLKLVRCPTLTSSLLSSFYLQCRLAPAAPFAVFPHSRRNVFSMLVAAYRTPFWIMAGRKRLFPLDLLQILL